MKRKKLWFIISALLTAIIMSLFIYINSIASGGLPDYTETISLKGLSDDVSVTRDKYAIPHIFAKTDEDAYRATGYLLAQDRLWQMDLLRHVTEGKLSEILGPDLLKADILLRSLQIPAKSKVVLDSISPKMLVALEAFADGINQYIDENSNDLPMEFTILGYKPEKWKPEYSINLIGYMAWDLSMAKKTEIVLHKVKSIVSDSKYKDLIPDMGLQKTAVFPDFGISGDIADSTLLSGQDAMNGIVPQILNGSNSWVVSGKKSTTGKPLFANDMHLTLNTPGIWYQIHQTTEEGLDVSGLLLPGQPFIIAGHNKDIAWGMTNVMLDDIDYYAETINPDNPNQYKFNGEWRDLKVIKEKINIKKDSVVYHETKYTHRGPIISEMKKVSDATISMHWTGNEYSNEIRSIYLLNRAKNWKDFRNALTTLTSVSQNVNYADKEGNIGMQCSAGVPIRKGNNGVQIFPGETDEYDWKGFVKFDSLPNVYNPESGYVRSANNKTAPDNYPYYISAWYDLSYRADRITEMLTEKEKLSPNDFKRMHNDQMSPLAKEMTPFIISAVEKLTDLTSEEKEALLFLKKWNYNYSSTSIPATFFEFTFVELSKNMFLDEMGEDLYTEFLKLDMMANYAIDKTLKAGKSDWCDDISTKDKKENLDDMLQKSFKSAVAKITAKAGKSILEKEWGKIHTLKLNHPMAGKDNFTSSALDFFFNMNRKDLPVGGSFHTVSPYSYKLATPFVSDHGSSHRHIFDLSNWDKSFTVIPTGNSGIPSSPHYCDQTDLYVAGKYHAHHFSQTSVIKNDRYTMFFTKR